MDGPTETNRATELDHATERFAERTVGEIVAEDYRRAAVFERLGIDFCCGGSQLLRDACRKQEIDPAAVERELVASNETPASQDETRNGDPERWGLAHLADHIVETHHRYVRETLPVLRRFSMKVSVVHGWARSELREINELVRGLSAELEEHMENEEEVVFPYIRALAREGEAFDVTGPPQRESDAFRPWLHDDHEQVGSLLRSIRRLSGEFVPPEGACSTYRAFYAKLEEFERNVHRHVHLENNVLFPRAAALEKMHATGDEGMAHA